MKADKFNKDYFWFNNFKPDVEIAIFDENVKADLKTYFKKVPLEVELRINQGMVDDPYISEFLKANVYYADIEAKMALINYINNKCHLDINPYTLNIKLSIDDDVYILIESKDVKKFDGIETLSIHAQNYYDFKNHFLNNNKYRDPSEFKKNFHSNSANDIYNFYVSIVKPETTPPDTWKHYFPGS